MHLRTAAFLVCLLQDGSPDLVPRQPELFGAGGTFVNAAADYDGDGDLDLFVGFNGAPNRLYRNDGVRFAEVGASVGLADERPTRAAAWGDFDGDGDSDLLVGFAPGEGSVLRLYRNSGGRFDNVTGAAGLTLDSGAVRQPVWVDLDADGDLDLFVALRDRPNLLFRNDGSGFVETGRALGLADPRRSVGAVWFDYDEDGDLDLYVANMDGEPNGLFRNDNGRFTDVAGGAGLAWGGRTPHEPAQGTVRPCAADVDGDGRLDLITANYGPPGLFLNRGAGRFEDHSATSGIAVDGRYDACALADVDNDGRLDLYLNGTVTGGVSYPDYLYRGLGGRFADVTPPTLRALEADHGVQWADFDADGDVDLALTGARVEGMHHVLDNRLTDPARSRSLRLLVEREKGGPGGPGSEIRVFEAGTGRLVATRLLDAGSGYNAQGGGPIHVGLPPGLGEVRIEVIPLPGPRRPVTATIVLTPGVAATATVTIPAQ